MNEFKQMMGNFKLGDKCDKDEKIDMTGAWDKTKSEPPTGPPEHRGSHPQESGGGRGRTSSDFDNYSSKVLKHSTCFQIIISRQNQAQALLSTRKAIAQTSLLCYLGSVHTWCPGTVPGYDTKLGTNVNPLFFKYPSQNSGTMPVAECKVEN